MDKLESIQAKARRLAQSGEFYGWLPIKFELRFEDGYMEALEWLNSPTTWEELDALCQKARSRKRARSAEGADKWA
jgi:hypothetical protein